MKDDELMLLYFCKRSKWPPRPYKLCGIIPYKRIKYILTKWLEKGYIEIVNCKDNVEFRICFTFGGGGYDFMNKTLELYKERTDALNCAKLLK